jgi:hypothetical protein
VMGEGEGVAESVVLYGLSVEVFVIIGFVGGSRSGEISSSSGFAMRKPPKDCERLRSLSIM